MNRRRAASVVVAGFGALGAAWWLHHGDAATGSTEPRATSIDVGDRLYASQAPQVQYQESSTLPTPVAAPRSAQVAPNDNSLAESNDKPLKPAPSGFAQGPLPTTDNLRSAPAIQASPQLQEAYQARVGRAALLDRRLERHIAELRSKAQNAGASERATLERDIAILEAQLAARRPYESPDKPSR